MKSTCAIFALFWAACTTLSGQITDPKATETWLPEPRKVQPGQTPNLPPSDAIVLFDGTGTGQWVSEKDSTEVRWPLNADSSMTVAGGTGNIRTRQMFGDCQLHIEWRTPPVTDPKQSGQLRGNSGVFLQSRYEVQVLDSYQSKTYSNGQAGAIYKQHIPLVNACRPPGEWQTYDIVFTAPRFNPDGIQVVPGRMTVIHNGVLIQNNVEIKGTTEYIGLPKIEKHGDLPILLQDHGDAVSYRNIWVRRI